jgi:hypothetical protein
MQVTELSNQLVLEGIDKQIGSFSSLNSETHHEISFEIEPQIQFNERYVVKNALSPSPFDIKYMDINREQLNTMAKIAFAIIAKNQSDGEFLLNNLYLEPTQLRLFGGLLLYHSDSTEAEEWRIMSNNPVNKDVYASRRNEGVMAMAMSAEVARVIDIPVFWNPNRSYPYGF